MKNYLLLLFIFNLAIFSCQSSSKIAEKENRPPNIILIMADDIGYEALGCYGGTSYQTPHLDALAKSGMLFQYAYSAPLCTPSRVQIMTGKYNFRNYIAFGILDPNEKTFGHYLQGIGYQTAVVGKWQLYGLPRHQKAAGGRVGSMPEQVGFNDYCIWHTNDKGSRYKHPRIVRRGIEPEVLEGKYGPDIFSQFAQEFIEKNKDQSFFLYYPMALVHSPFQPTPDHPDYANFRPRLDSTAYFADQVKYMDKIVRQIVDKLESLNLAENTLLLFVGDNGTHKKIVSDLNGQKIPGKKGVAKEWGTHVPMMAYWPGTIGPNQVNQNLVDFTDFLPTFLEASQHPGRDTIFTDGLSFYRQLNGQSIEGREWVFCHYDDEGDGLKVKRYVHDKTWKLYDDGSFYHFAEDPLEKDPIDFKNHPDSTELSQKVEQFQAVLNEMKN